MSDGVQFSQSTEAVEALVSRVSGRLMAEVDEVVGLAPAGTSLEVYLAKDSDSAKAAITRFLDREAPGTLVSYVVSGEFQAYPAG
jgi:hypothetical protein